MAVPTTQTAVVQTAITTSDLPLSINTSAPVPKPPTDHHVLVQGHAVALNPNDHKMVTYFNTPGSIAGCDFSGAVVTPPRDTTLAARFPSSTRVCGALFPYNPENTDNGSFAQYCVVDARILVKVPNNWSDIQAASLGVGWSTISLALSDPHALHLEGLPTKPTHTTKDPVLIYGAATASGTLACQMLKL
jgi:NADPH:quinone reductase-like Zn-dependent oxidoreductase